MKTLIKSLLVALTLTLVSFTVSQAEANKPIGRPKNVASFKSSMYVNNADKVQIAVSKELGGTVAVRLTNMAGAEFFFKQLGKNHQVVRLSIDVSALPDGIYQVSISNGVETTTQQLSLSTPKPVQPVRLIAIN